MFGFIGMPGHLELLIVAFIILLLFGNRLPSLMRSLGRGVVEFKQGLHGVDDDFDDDGDSSKSGKDEKIGSSPSDKVEKTVSEK
jgi:sec-independent protein translocase protein TatA